MARRFWMKPATFIADYFEIWSYGMCLKKGSTESIIKISFQNDGYVTFQIDGIRQDSFPKIFELSLKGADILNDRIQYGLLATHPQACTIYVFNIFNNLDCIRFGYTDEFRCLHIIEYHGHFTNRET